MLLSLALFAPLPAPAQSFTNSARLSAAVEGTNLVINYSLTTTQGWVTLFAADRLERLAAKAQPVDLAPVPPSMQGQFTVPINPAALAQFYKLLIEQWPSRGKARVFVGGPLDFDAMRLAYGDITSGVEIVGYTNICCGQPQPIYSYGPPTPMIFKQPVEVWLDNLGNYDTNGVLVGGNNGNLSGRFATTRIASQNTPEIGYPIIDRINSPTNDFRVNYLGDAGAAIDERQGILWSSEVQFYHDVNDYRNRFLNDDFINGLNLPAELAANLRLRQFRPDLDTLDAFPPVLARPTLEIRELFTVFGLRLFFGGNVESVPLRNRGPYQNYSTMSPLSSAYDSEDTVGDYAGLVYFWAQGTNSGYGWTSDGLFQSSDSSFLNEWQTKVIAAINNGLSAWAAYRYSGNTEVYKYDAYAHRIWAGRPCGGTNVPCEKGCTLRNVMMFDEANATAAGVFPFSMPLTLSNEDGPVPVQMVAFYVAAIFYDVAHEAGLGVYKADQLFWKSVSLITNNVYYPMRSFGATVQQAARALWPDLRPDRTGLSLYEEDIVDVLASRGIPMNGVADFRTNLPAVPVNVYVEIPASASPQAFASAHPSGHPGANSYGSHTVAVYRYEETNASTSYVAYQFYKHSKFGPCDTLAFTDGTFTFTNSGAFDWAYNKDGTYYGELVDREMGNVVVLLPGRTNHWMSSRQRCPNEAVGFYAEDVRPFGFRVIQATPNGFSFTVSAPSETGTNKTYQLTIVDPSLQLIGPATYTWSVTNYLGLATQQTGPVAQFTVEKDQPFTLLITRKRNNQTDTLTLRERGNDLDRSGGQAFVRNLVP